MVSSLVQKSPATCGDETSVAIRAECRNLRASGRDSITRRLNPNSKGDSPMFRAPSALIGLVLLSTAFAIAQDNPLSTEARQSWTRTKNNLLAAAEKMSEENYG